MTDETLSADLELETANPGETEPQPAPELENQQIEADADETDAEAEVVADDFEDIEYEGKSFKAPKALKEKLSRLDNMDAHFTRTNQANAETKRELEQLREQANQQLQASKEELGHRAQLQHVQAEIDRLKDYGWQQYQAHKQTDPAEADEVWQYVQHLQQQKGVLQQNLTQAEQKRTQEAEQEFATRREQTLEHARSKIKGWTPEVHQKVIAFAEEQGITPQIAKQFWSPQLYDILHMAMVGKQALSKSTAPKPAAPPPQLPTVGARGNARPALPSDKDNTADWIDKRNKQLAG